jgi:hypothetical protein
MEELLMFFQAIVLVAVAAVPGLLVKQTKHPALLAAMAA